MNLRKTIEELGGRYGQRRVVLVDEQDHELGEVGLLEAHRDPGLKHRAFSLFLYRKVNGSTELLLQRRSKEKPVFPLFWTNTCCYNLVKGEEYIDRAVSRVREEMGVVVSAEMLKALYQFSYYAPDIEGWCENELDTVILGKWDGEVTINPDEADDYQWMEWSALKADVDTNPTVYAPWFKTIMRDGRLATALGE
jgi:isopentenyl-diphosphate delta-isomerase